MWSKGQFGEVNILEISRTFFEINWPLESWSLILFLRGICISHSVVVHQLLLVLGLLKTVPTLNVDIYLPNPPLPTNPVPFIRRFRIKKEIHTHTFYIIINVIKSIPPEFKIPTYTLLTSCVNPNRLWISFLRHAAVPYLLPKGGLISESFSLWLQSQKKVPNYQYC